MTPEHRPLTAIIFHNKVPVLVFVLLFVIVVVAVFFV